MTLATAPDVAASPSLDDFRAGKPGVYEDVPADVYHALDAASASRLNKLRRSPAHCRYDIDHPDDAETDAKSLGTAGHACLLEPELFRARYAIGPDVKLNTKAGKEEWEAFCAANPGKCHLRGADGEKLVGMHRAVWSHPAARHYLSEKAQHELSILWTDKRTGALCKSRLDRYVGRRGAIIDLKTTRDASPKAFAKSVYEYGYHRQAAMNLSGAQALGLVARAFCIVAVENEPPHVPMVYLLDDAAITQGARELPALIETWAKCTKSDEWPGYGDEAAILNLLPWHRDADAGF